MRWRRRFSIGEEDTSWLGYCVALRLEMSTRFGVPRSEKEASESSLLPNPKEKPNDGPGALARFSSRVKRVRVAC